MSRKPFYITYLGNKIYPDNINSTNIELRDIAHHLAKIQRFGGSLPIGVSYSVAEHSLIMAQYALDMYDVEVAKACLLHDASEAYLGDIVSSLKKQLTDYKNIETTLQGMIYSKYGVNTSETSEIVDELDKRLLLNEAKHFFYDKYDHFKCQTDLQPLRLGNMYWGLTDFEARYEFLMMCEELGIKDDKR